MKRRQSEEQPQGRPSRDEGDLLSPFSSRPTDRSGRRIEVLVETQVSSEGYVASGFRVLPAKGAE